MELFAVLPPEEFGPLKLIELQNHLIQLDWSRGVINQRIGMIKRMFKWAVARQYVSPVLYHGLTAVEGLRRGRSAARETARVKPVEEKYVYAILRYLGIVDSPIATVFLTLFNPGKTIFLGTVSVLINPNAGQHRFYRPLTLVVFNPIKIR